MALDCDDPSESVDGKKRVRPVWALFFAKQSQPKGWHHYSGQIVSRVVSGTQKRVHSGSLEEGETNKNRVQRKLGEEFHRILHFVSGQG